MIPAAILVAIIGGAIGLWLVSHGSSTRAADSQIQGDLKQLRREHDALRAAIDELLIGHVNEARLKRALSHVFKDE